MWQGFAVQWQGFAQRKAKNALSGIKRKFRTKHFPVENDRPPPYDLALPSIRCNLSDNAFFNLLRK
jgi:hypothetical protein